MAELATSPKQSGINFAQRITTSEMTEEQGDEMISRTELGGTASGAMFVKVNQLAIFGEVARLTEQRESGGCILKGRVCKIASHGESCIGWSGDFPIYMYPRPFCYLQCP